MSERYSPLATVAPPEGTELYDVVEDINDDLEDTDYVIFSRPFEDYVIARADESGDWEVVGVADMYGEKGDEFEATDAIAEVSGDEYVVVSKPHGTRKLVFDHNRGA